MRQSQFSRITLAAAACAVGLAAVASAAPKGEKPAPKAPVGLQAAVDANGKLRQPTPEEMQALSSEFSRTFLHSKTAAQSTVWPDGTVSLVLGADALSVSIARVNADGSLSQACVTGLDQAAAAVANGTAGLEVK